MLPSVAFGDRAGLELVHPMAVVVLGGLLTATLVNLFVLPVLYPRMGSHAEAEQAEVDVATDLSRYEERLGT